MERSSIWGATIAQVRLSCYQFVLGASSPKFQSQQSLRSFRVPIQRDCSLKATNPSQTPCEIGTKPSEAGQTIGFSSVSLDLLAETASPYQGCDNWQEYASPWAQSENQHLLSLTKGGCWSYQKVKYQKVVEWEAHNPLRFWPSVGERVISRPRICAVFPLWHVGDCYGTCHGLGQDDFYWNDDQCQNRFSQAFRPEPVRWRETCKQNPQTFVKFEETLQMTSNDHGLPAQVKSAILTLGHCALHFSGTSSPWLKIASHKYSGHPWYRTFQLLKKPTNVLLATTPFLQARGSSASTFLRWLCRQEEFQVLQNSGHEGVATHKLQNTACCLVTALDAASLNVWIIEGRNDFVIRLLLAWHPCTELDSSRGKAGYGLLGQRSI